MPLFRCALANGNFVVDSPRWNNVGATHAGAVTWAKGSTGIVGTVSSANSLVGAQVNDSVGQGDVLPLDNGDYVIASTLWANGASAHAGAVTLGSGSSGVFGYVSATNSLVGSSPNDGVGFRVRALGNSNFVTGSQAWNNTTAGASKAGAVTWSSDKAQVTGVVAPSNSFVGVNVNDQIGSGVPINTTIIRGIHVLGDGNYLILSSTWSNGAATSAGAVTLANGRFPLRGSVQAGNSVVGTLTDEGTNLPFDYDPMHQQVIVGRPQENIVSLLTLDQLFANGFE